MRKNNLNLILKNITKRFKNFYVIQNFSAIFTPNKITAIVGPNGAGKTTLFHLIMGEVRPDYGEIIFNGENLVGLCPWEVARKGISRLFQDIRIFENLTVHENVMISCFSNKEESPLFAFNYFKKSKIKKLIKEKAEKYIEIVGLQNQINKKAGELSYGQQKLLALTRLLAFEPDVYLLDEPTAGISPFLKDKILEILLNLNMQNKILIIIEHNTNLVFKIAHYVYFINEGKLYYSGPTDDVLEKEEIKGIYFGLST